MRHLIVVAMASCGGSRTPAPATHTATDLGPLCRAHYVHQQTCADAYLDALLDVRIELDRPPGIADEAKAKGKPAMIELARVEFTRDTAPEKVDAICSAISSKTPPDQVERLFDDGTHCAAMTDCKAFAACAVAGERSYIANDGCHTDDCKAVH